MEPALLAALAGLGLVWAAGFFIALAFAVGILYGKLYWSVPLQSTWLRMFPLWSLYKQWVSFRVVDYDGMRHESIADYQKAAQGHAKTGPVQYVYACYPHGLFAVSPFLAFCATCESWDKRDVPRPVVLVHSLLLQIPILREFAYLMGCDSIDRASFAQQLKDGTKPLALVPGGVREMILNSKGNAAVEPPNHVGFLDLVFQKGRDAVLVPCWSPNENRLFWTWDILRPLRLWCTRRFRYPFPTLFVGPLPVDLTMYVGRPIRVNQFSRPEELRKEFFAELDLLKEKYKV